MSKQTLLFGLLIFAISLCHAQESWPRKLEGKDLGKFSIYEPQLEKLQGNILSGRAAISLSQKSSADPLFGAIWFKAEMETDRTTRMAELKKLEVTDIRLPELKDSAEIEKIISYLESEIPKWKLRRTLDDIATELENEDQGVAENLKNEPPVILYVKKQSVLVFIDGQPKLEQDQKLKMPRVVNSVFLILQYPKDKHFYLRGSASWYMSDSITTGWTPVKKLPKDLLEIDKQIKQQSPDQTDTVSSTPPAVIVTTSPAELIQTKGEASFAPIDSTNLLYVSNSDDDLFMHAGSSTFYVLLSGRWYSSSSLNGPWAFVQGAKLPADFAKIPRGSKKDAILSSVPGTDEAHDAVIDAQLPQTAKVERSKATCTVKYDGDPAFDKIEGTMLYIAKNSSSTVIKASDGYYCVENGVWFISPNANGPWKVSDSRPKDVEKIPASSPAYNIKYVYIYETTPQYVYVGYTPGYMGCYVAGPVVVYGTGYYYYPWYGVYYYPRPVTYGFSMHYNPYTGWHLGFHYSSGFFSFHVWVGGHPGYWGPPMYRPPYYHPYHGGMYGHNGPVYVNRNVNININHTNNIYTNRAGVSTRDIQRNNPGNSTAPRTNNLVSDRQGNVYKQNQNGSLQQRNNGSWSPTQGPSTNEANRQIQNQQRGQQRNQNFDQSHKKEQVNAGRPSTNQAGRTRK